MAGDNTIVPYFIKKLHCGIGYVYLDVISNLSYHVFISHNKNKCVWYIYVIASKIPDMNYETVAEGENISLEDAIVAILDYFNDL